MPTALMSVQFRHELPQRPTYNLNEVYLRRHDPFAAGLVSGDDLSILIMRKSIAMSLGGILVVPRLISNRVHNSLSQKHTDIGMA